MHRHIEVAAVRGVQYYTRTVNRVRVRVTWNGASDRTLSISERASERGAGWDTVHIGALENVVEHGGIFRLRSEVKDVPP